VRAITLALLFSAATHVLPAQSRPTVVGTWRLVSSIRTDSSGRQTPTYGEHPLGRIMYTADGHMAAQLYDASRAKLGADLTKADPAAVRAAFQGMATYFGRYTLDTVAHTVTHDVEGAYSPDWIGGRLVRSYRFVGANRIELTVLTTFDGKKAVNPTVLVWERLGK
jgi:hypothetical protein